MSQIWLHIKPFLLISVLIVCIRPLWRYKLHFHYALRWFKCELVTLVLPPVQALRSSLMIGSRVDSRHVQTLPSPLAYMPAFRSPALLWPDAIRRPPPLHPACWPPPDSRHTRAARFWEPKSSSHLDFCFVLDGRKNCTTQTIFNQALRCKRWPKQMGVITEWQTCWIYCAALPTRCPPSKGPSAVVSSGQQPGSVVVWAMLACSFCCMKQPELDMICSPRWDYVVIETYLQSL